MDAQLYVEERTINSLQKDRCLKHFLKFNVDNASKRLHTQR